MRDRRERLFSLSYNLQQPFDAVLGEIGIEVAESVKGGDGRNDEVVLDSRGRCMDCLCRLGLEFFVIGGGSDDCRLSGSID